MFEFVEEAFDQITLPLEPFAESRWIEPVWHRPDIGPCAALLHGVAQSVGIVGPVGQQDIARHDAVEHVVGAAPVMRLALGQLEMDGQAAGIDKGVDLGRKPAPRTAHAIGSAVFFLPLAPCWWTRMDDESII